MTRGAHPFQTLIEPPALISGARVALVSPSGPLRDASEVERAEATAKSLGWETVVGASATKRFGYFAGTDEERAADFNAAVADPDIHGVWCLRGGYGAMRILGLLDLAPLRAQPKALLGYSDITALHSAWSRVGIVSYHAPTARAELTQFSRDSLERAAVSRIDSCGVVGNAQVLRAGRATGRLVGGNLSLASALCGTPWALNFRDAIVVLEDINEAVYRVDRMLTQFRLAGAFDGCRGLVFGDFGSCDENSDDGSRTLLEVATETAEAVGVPAMYGAPVGHIADQWTIPLGAAAELDTASHTLRAVRDVR